MVSIVSDNIKRHDDVFVINFSQRLESHWHISFNHLLNGETVQLRIVREMRKIDICLTIPLRLSLHHNIISSNMKYSICLLLTQKWEN